MKKETMDNILISTVLFFVIVGGFNFYRYVNKQLLNQEERLDFIEKDFRERFDQIEIKLKKIEHHLFVKKCQEVGGKMEETAVLTVTDRDDNIINKKTAPLCVLDGVYYSPSFDTTEGIILKGIKEL